HRRGVRATADGYTLLLASTANAINATLYDKLSFSFIRDIAPVATISREAPDYAREPIGFGHVCSRIHRLCQSQSGQDQHDIGWHRERAAFVRRAVQDDGWRQLGARALSRRRARADRSDRWAGDVRYPGRVDRVHQGRQASAFSRDDRDALGSVAERSDR